MTISAKDDTFCQPGTATIKCTFAGHFSATSYPIRLHN